MFYHICGYLTDVNYDFTLDSVDPGEDTFNFKMGSFPVRFKTKKEALQMVEKLRKRKSFWRNSGFTGVVHVHVELHKWLQKEERSRMIESWRFKIDTGV